MFLKIKLFLKHKFFLINKHQSTEYKIMLLLMREHYYETRKNTLSLAFFFHVSCYNRSNFFLLKRHFAVDDDRPLSKCRFLKTKINLKDNKGK